MRIRPLVVQTLCGLAAALCIAGPGHASGAVTSSSLYPAITALIGDAACDTQDQCHAVGVGARPCGGPGGYLAWSDKSTDGRALLGAVQAHAAAQKAENEASGKASDCRAIPVPSAVCRPRASDGKTSCQLEPGGGLAEQPAHGGLQTRFDASQEQAVREKISNRSVHCTCSAS